MEHMGREGWSIWGREGVEHLKGGVFEGEGVGLERRSIWGRREGETQDHSHFLE